MPGPTTSVHVALVSGPSADPPWVGSPLDACAGAALRAASSAMRKGRRKVTERTTGGAFTRERTNGGQLRATAVGPLLVGRAGQRAGRTKGTPARSPTTSPGPNTASTVDARITSTGGPSATTHPRSR